MFAFIFGLAIGAVIEFHFYPIGRVLAFFEARA